MRATRHLGTVVEPLLVKPRRNQTGDPVLPGCLERAGALRVCGRVPGIIGLSKLQSFDDRPMALRRTAPPGWSSRSRIAMNVSRTHSDRMGAVRCGGPVRRPSSVSGRVVQVARGGFRRLCPPQHGTQGRLAQRRAQLPVGPEGVHDLGRGVLLPP